MRRLLRFILPGRVRQPAAWRERRRAAGLLADVRHNLFCRAERIMRLPGNHILQLLRLRLRPAAMKTHRIAMRSLEAVASNRAEGYLDAVRAAAIEVGERHVLLSDSEYQRLREQYPPLRVPDGPGTELKKLLRSVGIVASPGCSCNARAQRMDERGCDWCEQNLDEIVGWLREEATKRRLPFIDAAGRVLVRRAIANARRAEAGRAQETEQAKGSAV